MIICVLSSRSVIGSLVKEVSIMADFVFKLSGPQRALEIQVPVAGNGAATALKKLLTDNEKKQAEAAQKKKHWWQRSNSQTNEKPGASTTALVLLTSLVLSALDD